MEFYSMLSLRNFRGFRKSKKIPLAPLTFLVGPNSSGKSSVFDAILLLAQSHFIPSIFGTQRPSWGGPLVDLGSYTDAVYDHKPKLSIEITVRATAWSTPRKSKRAPRREETEICFGLRTTKNDPIGRLASVSLTDVRTKQKISVRFYQSYVAINLLNKIIRQKLKDISPRWRGETYLEEAFSFYPETGPLEKIINQVLKSESSRLKGRKAAWHRIKQAISYYPLFSIITEVERVASGRTAPRRWYSVVEMEGTGMRTYHGTQVFRDVDPRMLSEPSDHRFYIYRRRRKRVSFTLNSALEKLNIASSIEPSQLSAYHSVINVQDNITGVSSNLIDVGYGASQVIPVLRACTSQGLGPLFVEQPEIHLHPQAQSTLSEILCETSLQRQVIVETHSVHMINRARILIAEGKLSADHVIINFISRTPSGSQVHSIRLLENGDFVTDWPVGYGFFDERYQDTMRLLSLKHARGES
jgi:predicted ATPase